MEFNRPTVPDPTETLAERTIAGKYSSQNQQRKTTTQAQEPAFDSTLKGENQAKQFIIPRVPNDFKESTIPEPYESQSECTTGSKYISQNKQCTTTSSQSHQETAYNTNLKDLKTGKSSKHGTKPQYSKRYKLFHGFLLKQAC